MLCAAGSNDAYETLSRAHELAPLEADDLEQLAWAAALTERDDEVLALLERLYQVRLESGDGLKAARAAFWLGFRLINLGADGTRDWVARSCTTKRRRRGVRMRTARLSAAADHYRESDLWGDRGGACRRRPRAVEIGQHCGDRDLVAFVRAIQGRMLLRQGRVEDGLGLLDEAWLRDCGRAVALIAGLIYCGVISCCQQVYALDRAREWTSALADWCKRSRSSSRSPAAASCTARRSCSSVAIGWRRSKRHAARASVSRGPDREAGAARLLSARRRSTGCVASSPLPKRHIAEASQLGASLSRASRCCGWPRSGTTRPLAPSVE